MNKSTWLVSLLGIAGVVVSYAKFIEWNVVNGLHLIEPWREAMTASIFGAGLHWDLIFSLAIVLAIAWADRRRLGGRWALAVAALGCTLGVCAALALYWARLRHVAASEQTALEQAASKQATS